MVFIIRGLTYNWKLPVAYYLSADPLKAEMLEKVWRSVVSEILKIGLDVRASVCDQAAPNRKMFKNLGVTVNKPFINLNRKKIYALFDWVHLLTPSGILIKNMIFYLGKEEKKSTGIPLFNYIEKIPRVLFVRVLN